MDQTNGPPWSGILFRTGANQTLLGSQTSRKRRQVVRLRFTALIHAGSKHLGGLLLGQTHESPSSPATCITGRPTRTGPQEAVKAVATSSCCPPSPAAAIHRCTLWAQLAAIDRPLLHLLPEPISSPLKAVGAMIPLTLHLLSVSYVPPVSASLLLLHPEGTSLSFLIPLIPDFKPNRTVKQAQGECLGDVSSKLPGCEKSSKWILLNGV